MRNYTIHRVLLFAITVFLILALSCTTGKMLMSHVVQEGDVDAGPFTLILYSTSEYNYLKAVAFLDIEGDAYEIKPFGAQFNYSIVKGLAGKEAVHRAKEFISSRVLYNDMELRAIKDPVGNIVGYELRHLQLPFTYGVSDVLDVNYVSQPDGKVTVYVELKTSVARILERRNRR